MNALEMKSKSVLECLNVLKSIVRRNNITLMWANEKADALAKRGAATHMLQPRPICGIFTQTAKSWLNEWLRNLTIHMVENIQSSAISDSQRSYSPVSDLIVHPTMQKTNST